MRHIKNGDAEATKTLHHLLCLTMKTRPPSAATAAFNQNVKLLRADLVLIT